MDLAATLKACQRLRQRAPEIIAEELKYISRNKVGLIIGDIPPLCFAIAKRASIRSVAITNFTWDFIYRDYIKQHRDFLSLVVDMEQSYSQATLALTLPFSCELDVFPRREKIPWIARVSPLTRVEAREKFALPRSALIVLLSFGGLGLKRLRWEELKQQREYYFVASGATMKEDGNLRIVPDARQSYADLIRAADIIVTKPGYGIVADAIAHQVPVLYTDRGEFAEYANLVEALNECVTAEFIPQADLFAGKLAPHLSRILTQTVRNQPPFILNGATVAAQKIMSLLENLESAQRSNLAELTR